jgi:hypothetical protein
MERGCCFDWSCLALPHGSFACSAAQGKILADWANSGSHEDYFTKKGTMKITLGGVEYMLLQAFVDDEIPGLALKKVVAPFAMLHLMLAHERSEFGCSRMSFDTLGRAPPVPLSWSRSSAS